jgi:hypothetical protein
MSGSGVAPSGQALVISVTFEPPASCRVGVSGESFSLPSDEARFLETLVRRAARIRDARVSGDANIPYRCFGYAFFLTQRAGYLAHRAGFKRIGFTAEPPSAPPAR